MSGSAMSVQYAGERKAIAELRDLYPTLGLKVLANRIFNRNFPAGSESFRKSGLAGAPARTLLSIYSVLRRDAAKRGVALHTFSAVS